jgi:hypothetical protein
VSTYSPPNVAVLQSSFANSSPLSQNERSRERTDSIVVCNITVLGLFSLSNEIPAACLTA